MGSTIWINGLWNRPAIWVFSVPGSLLRCSPRTSRLKGTRAGKKYRNWCTHSNPSLLGLLLQSKLWLFWSDVFTALFQYGRKIILSPLAFSYVYADCTIAQNLDHFDFENFISPNCSNFALECKWNSSIS